MTDGLASRWLDTDRVALRRRSAPPGEDEGASVEFERDDADRAGYDTEFSEFVASRGRELARTAWLLCGDAHQAEDLVQEALVRTFLKWRTAREGEPLAYARRVLANQKIDRWRKSRRETLSPPEELPERGASGDMSMVGDRDRLVRALRQLPPQRRKIVVLRHLMGLRESEVAADLGVSVGTVKSTASRSLAQLRRILGEDDRDGNGFDPPEVPQGRAES